MKKLFEFDVHIGAFRVLIQGKDIANGVITLEKLGRDVIEWVRGLFDGLSGRISTVERNVSELQKHQQPEETKPNYYVLTQAEYDALTHYEHDVPYFIVERTNTQWRFGDNLPIILGGYGTTLGEPFPILLN